MKVRSVRRVLLWAFASAIAAPAVAAPGDMSVATFIAKADALKAKGILAIGSPDIALLQSEAKAAGLNFRNKLKADAAAKRPLAACPPAKSSLNSDELMGFLRAYPVAIRARTSMNTAMSDLMKRRYPCN